jgi:predicted permease
MIRLFPEGFRRRFGDEIREQIGDDYDGAAAMGPGALLWFVVTTVVDVIASALAELWRPTWTESDDSTHPLGRRRMRMGDWWRDLRQAARSLARARGFMAVTVGTLGLAIGINAGIFSVVRTVLLDPLPFANAEDLVVIRGTAGPDLSYNLSDEFYVQFSDSELLQSVAFWNQFTSSLRVGEETERARMAAPSTNVFETLGAEPILGRLPTPDDDQRVAVLSYDFWRERYGADPGVLGRSVFASGADLTIIGVMGPDFFLPTEGITLWIPQVLEPSEIVPDVVTGGPSMVARLAPGVTRAELEDELTALARRIPERFGGPPAYQRQIQDFRPLIVPLAEELLGSVRGPLWILFAAVGVVLLIACANVANLFMVRAEDRLRETAVRRALGAGRARLIGSLFSEAVLVAGGAGVLAVVLARVCLPLILAAAPPNVPRLGDVALGRSSVFCWRARC